MIWLAAALLSFAIGSLPTGYLVGRWRGVDLRQLGSGNIGASNCARQLGFGWGALVLAVDLSKGVFCAGALPGLLEGAQLGAAGEAGRFECSLLAGLASALGHCYTPWLGGRGGKGVATSAGALLIWSPEATGVAIAVWVLVAWRTRVASLASLAAALSVSLLAPLFDRQLGRQRLDLRLGGTLLLLGLVALRHRQNLNRLARGTELRMREEREE